MTMEHITQNGRTVAVMTGNDNDTMIHTERLCIRPLRPDDWRAMQRIAADFQASPYAVYDRPLPTEDTAIRTLTAAFADTHLFFAVLRDSVMIGYVCFHEENGNYDIGFCFHSEYHGQGYARESCAAVMDFVARENDVHAFTAGTALQNTPSRRLLETLGFVLEGTETVLFPNSTTAFEGGKFIRKI